MKLTGIVKIRNVILQGDTSSWMFYVIIFLVISLPLSEFGMSIAQITLVLLWAHEGAVYHHKDLINSSLLIKYLRAIALNLNRKIKILSKNRMLILVIALYLFHVIGLTYSSDYNYALKDLRIKMPLLILPLILASIEAITFRKLFLIFQCFVSAVVVGTLISIYIKLTNNITDNRELSVFISHIRFALMICFSIFILAFFLLKGIYNGKVINSIIFITLLWLIVFLFILKSLTGIFILILGAILIIIASIINYRKLLLIFIGLLFIFFTGSYFYINSISKDLTVAKQIEISKLDQFTSNGNYYIHDTANYGIEGGSYVGLYLSEVELEKAWNARSSLNYNDLDKKGQHLKTTLIRYLHSKGLRKDSSGLKELNSSDIIEIENGIANANYINNLSLRPIIEQFLQGYQSYKINNNPNASSFMQRVEYWKTSLYLIKNEPIWGYGTGDIEREFIRAYKNTNSLLKKEYQHRSHNQFMAIYIALGLPGLLIFLSSLVIPPLKLKKFSNYFFLVFFFIVALSMITEDTLETQPGVTFFSFFNSLLLFGLSEEADTTCRFKKST